MEPTFPKQALFVHWKMQSCQWNMLFAYLHTFYFYTHFCKFFFTSLSVSWVFSLSSLCCCICTTFGLLYMYWNVSQKYPQTNYGWRMSEILMVQLAFPTTSFHEWGKFAKEVTGRAPVKRLEKAKEPIQGNPMLGTVLKMFLAFVCFPFTEGFTVDKVLSGNRTCFCNLLESL